jgi:hypothetical protein
MRRPSFLALPFLLASVLVGAERTAHSNLLLIVRPEALLLRQGSDAVQLKIRLAEGTEARLWGADSCGAPASGAMVISRSDSYIIPLSAFGASNSRQACLASSDGTLQRSVTLRQ